MALELPARRVVRTPARVRCAPRALAILIWAAPGAAFGPAPAAGSDEPADYLVPPEEGGSLRVLSLGGAFVGLADDAGTVATQPAGLVVVPRSFEIVAAPSGSFGGRPRHAAVALHPSPRVALGVGWRQSTPEDLLGVDGSRPEGRESSAFAGVGFSFPDRRFSGGLAAEWRRFSFGHGDPPEHDRAFGWTAGLLFRPDNRETPRLGFRYVAESEWTLGDGRRARRPGVFSGGISWHYRALRLTDVLLSLQGDWVFFSALTRGAPESAQARNDLDVRLGVELSFPFGCFTGCGSLFQLRGGLRNAAPRPFDRSGRRTSDEVGQGPERENRLFVGGAVALRSVLQGRIKAEMLYDFGPGAFSIGLGWRFPEAYRAEIENERRR